MSEKRSPAYICQSGYEDGDQLCQSMTSRPVDAAVVEAFLQSVSPLSLEVGLRVLEQLENDLAVQRRQRELQLEQARYEARLAQRQYDAVDPPNIHYFQKANPADYFRASGCQAVVEGIRMLSGASTAAHCRCS